MSKPQKRPLPPHFDRNDLDMSNPVDRGIKAGLQRDRAGIIAGVMAANAEDAIAYAIKIEERQAQQAFRERRALMQQYEHGLERAGREFEARHGRGVERRGRGHGSDLER